MPLLAPLEKGEIFTGSLDDVPFTVPGVTGHSFHYSAALLCKVIQTDGRWKLHGYSALSG